MTLLTRRTGLLATAALTLPRFAIGQSDTRKAITVAVQRISVTNALDDLREQSNTGHRLSAMYVERLIDLNYQGQLEQVPGLATAWRRIDDRTLELDIRRGVICHNADELTAEDVVFSFGPERMMGATRPTVDGKTLPLSGVLVTTARTKALPAEIPPVARRLWPALDRVDVMDRYTVRFVNATPDVTSEGRLPTRGSGIVNRRAFDAAKSWLDYSRNPVGTGPYKVREYRPDVSLTLEAHDQYWGGRRRCEACGLWRCRRYRRAWPGCSRANISSPAIFRPTRSKASRNPACSKRRAAPSRTTAFTLSTRPIRNCVTRASARP